METASNFIEAVLIFYILKRSVGRNDGKIKKQLLGMMVLGMFITILNQILNQSSLKGIIILLAQIMYAVICFSGKWTEKIIWGLSFTMIALIAERITFRFAEIMDMNQISDLLVQGAVRNQMMAVYLTACIVLTVVTAEARLKSIQLALSHQILLVSLMIVGAATLDKLLDVAIIIHDLGLPRSICLLIEGISLLMLFILVLLLAEICYLGQVYHQNQELKEKHLMEAYEYKEYEVLKASADNMREWRHDLKSQLHTVAYLMNKGNYEDAIRFVNSLYGSTEKELSSINIGNPVLGVVIAMRKKRAEQSGIRFYYQTMWCVDVKLNDAELAALLGNLLDNAVEACERIQNCSDRFIHLTIAPCREMMKITVENSFDGRIQKKNGKFISLKEKAGHGIGTIRVKKLVESCGGYLEYQIDETVFRVHILLPIKENIRECDKNRFD